MSEFKVTIELVVPDRRSLRAGVQEALRSIAEEHPEIPRTSDSIGYTFDFSLVPQDSRFLPQAEFEAFECPGTTRLSELLQELNRVGATSKDITNIVPTGRTDNRGRTIMQVFYRRKS